VRTCCVDWRSIGDSDDDLGRMLGTLRFWFTKDLVGYAGGRIRAVLIPAQKYVKGKPCKPYNSTLGEFFRVRDTRGTRLRTADPGSVTGRLNPPTRL
jgi:hypothetical protein